MPLMNDDPRELAPNQPPASGNDAVSLIDTSLTSLIRKRAAFKRKITGVFNRVDASNERNISVSIDIIESYIDKITALDEQITDLYANNDQMFANMETEVDNQTDYNLDVSLRLDELRGALQPAAPTNPPTSNAPSPNTNSQPL